MITFSGCKDKRQWGFLIKHKVIKNWNSLKGCY